MRKKLFKIINALAVVSMGYENMSVAKSYNTILYSMENQSYTNEAGEEIENYVQVNEVNGYS